MKKAASFVVVLAFSCAGCFVTRGRDAETVSCTAGATIEIGCSERCGLGSCTGDSVLLICDGTTSVGACQSGGDSGPTVLGRNDDSSCGGSTGSSLCSDLTVTCPPSGSITVTHHAFSGRSYSCRWETRDLSGI